MAYNPGVQNRSAEFLAQGIGGAFKSVTDAMELRRERTDEINKTDGELKAFGQTLQGLVKLGTIHQSAVDDYNNVLGADVKTKQGYLNQSVKSLNLIFEADRNAREIAQSKSTLAIQDLQLAQLKQVDANNKAFTEAMGGMPTTVYGKDATYVPAILRAPTANLNDFLYGGGKTTPAMLPNQGGMAPSMGGDLTQDPTGQTSAQQPTGRPSRFYSGGLQPIPYRPGTEGSVQPALDPFNKFTNSPIYRSDNDPFGDISRARGTPAYQPEAPYEPTRAPTKYVPEREGMPYMPGMDSPMVIGQMEAPDYITRKDRYNPALGAGLSVAAGLAAAPSTKGTSTVSAPSVGGKVLVKSPFELTGLLYEDTEKGIYRVLDDVAEGLKIDARGKINNTTQQIDALQDLLKNGRETAIDMAGGFGTGSVPIPLLASERAKLVPQLTNLKTRLGSEEQSLRAIEDKITAAEKYAGTPLLKKAPTGDPVVKSTIKILELPSIIQRELKRVETKTERPLTSDEKLSFMTKEFIKKGGIFTPKLLKEIKDSTKSDVQVYVVDGVTFVTIDGSAPMAFDRKKPLTAGLSKVQSQERYSAALTLAANVGMNGLLPADKATLAELNTLYGDKNSITGARIPLADAVNARRRDLGLGQMAAAETFIATSKTGVPSSLSRFKIEQ